MNSKFIEIAFNILKNSLNSNFIFKKRVIQQKNSYLVLKIKTKQKIKHWLLPKFLKNFYLTLIMEKRSNFFESLKKAILSKKIEISNALILNLGLSYFKLKYRFRS